MRYFFVLLALFFAKINATALAEEFQFRAEGVLGASYALTVESSNEGAARSAHEAAIREIARLESILSTWKADSEISRLNAASDFTASQELYEFLTSCEAIREETQNAFSCRVGKLINVWRQAQETGVAPDEAAVQKLAKEIADAPVEFDPATKTIRRPENVVFAVDAMAKGWILDRAAARALAVLEDVSGVILNIGGDIKIAGDIAPDAPRIGIANPGAGDNEAPMETISVARGGVAASGAGKRDMEVAGKKYSHILSPKTGMPQDVVVLSTVVAPTAAEADALATAFAVMGADNSLGFANARDGAEAVIVTASGERFVSGGWASLVASAETATAVEAVAEIPWPDGFQLDIDYAIPTIDAAFYEAPYVAVWVTNPKRKLVRSLLLLGNEPRWVEENHRYWRRYGRKQPEIIDALAQPTKLPGEYHLVWDGRDEAGEPVPQGTYILHVEASREQGGHSYTNYELQLSGDVLEASIPAQEEIGEVTLRYGPGQ